MLLDLLRRPSVITATANRDSATGRAQAQPARVSRVGGIVRHPCLLGMLRSAPNLLHSRAVGEPTLGVSGDFEVTVSLQVHVVA